MRDKDLYAQILGVESPWMVSDVELVASAEEVRVRVGLEDNAEMCCPECDQVSPGYDSRERRWRHLDTCQYKTILIAQVPRVECSTHGVTTVKSPWAEPGSGFTAMFESLVIDWLQEASISAVARLMGISWNAIDNIMQRAVKRGLERRDNEECYTSLGIDETAFRKRHDYVTIVSDSITGNVVHVADDRKKQTLKGWYLSLTKAQLESVESISMDMWPAFINATLESVPEAETKICFDKFHVAKYLGEAVDKVRRQENKSLIAEGCDDLKGSRYMWLHNPTNMSHSQKIGFKSLRESSLRTARAWAIKQTAMNSWHYKTRTWAIKAWEQWYGWAIRSRLAPVKKAAKTIKTHLWGILNAVVLKASNGPAESLNSRIKMIKVRARGFRNKQRYATAIYFHLGGLNLHPH